MAGGLSDCCKMCCYSTPYGTIFSLSITIVGLVGFLSSTVYSIALISQTPTLANNTIIFAPIVGGVAGTTLFPLIMTTILAYCVTGYVRDELYHPFVKACVGPMCNIWTMILTFFYLVVWLCMSMVLTFIVTVYIQLAWLCPQFDNTAFPEKCITFGSESSAAMEVCVREPGDLCDVGRTIGLALTISNGFSIIVIIGLVLVLMVQAGNFIGVRESNKRSYKPGGNY